MWTLVVAARTWGGHGHDPAGLDLIFRQRRQPSPSNALIASTLVFLPQGQRSHVLDPPKGPFIETRTMGTRYAWSPQVIRTCVCAANALGRNWARI